MRNFRSKFLHGTGKKTPGGAGTLTRDTRDTRETRAHKGTRTTQTNLTTIQTHQHTVPVPVKRHRITEHTDEPHNHPNPPTLNPHDSETTETAADSTAAAPEPTAP
jgi:hypothetical protein